MLYIGWTLPSDNGGACQAMYQHLVEHEDFEIHYLSSSPNPGLKSPFTAYSAPSLWSRLQRTRLHRILRQIDILSLGRRMLPLASKIIREFSPDFVFTIPDNDVSWAAHLTARKHQLPLIVNFQDWWPRNQFAYKADSPFLTTRLIERRFKAMHQASALCFCTSEGMMEKLGRHHNATVLLPCPSRAGATVKTQSPHLIRKPLRLIYAGSLYSEYGAMALKLARALVGHSDYQLLLYGPAPENAPQNSDLAWAKANGIYQGCVPHSQIPAVLESADAFLSVMGFSESNAVMSRVSFTTKVLEYSKYGKPILIWGPSHCPPVRLCRSFDYAIPISSPEPQEVVNSLARLLTPDEYGRYSAKAFQASQTVFSHDSIHATFRDSIIRTIVPGVYK